MARHFIGGEFSLLGAGSAAITAAPFTVAGWAHQGPGSGASENGAFSIAHSIDTGKHYWRLHMEGGSQKKVAFSAKGGNPAAGKATTLTNWVQGVWHHLCGVEISANSRAVYLDGGGKGTNTTSRTPVGVNRTHMGSIMGGDLYFEGHLAHWGLWTVALTDDEIFSLAQGVSPLRIRRNALQNYWHLGGQSPELDIRGNLNMDVFFSPPRSEDPPLPHASRAPGGA